MIYGPAIGMVAGARTGIEPAKILSKELKEMRADVLEETIRLEIEQQAERFGVDYYELSPNVKSLAAVACNRATLRKRRRSGSQSRDWRRGMTSFRIRVSPTP